MNLTKRQQKVAFAALIAILATILAVTEVVEGERVLSSLVGLAVGMGVADGVNLRAN